MAWALNDTTRWWWPEPIATSYWPDPKDSDPSVNALRRMFEARHFVEATRADAEACAVAVALYADEYGEAAHVARSLGNGSWTSKLGQRIDAEHTLEALEGRAYGRVVAFYVPPASA